MVFWASYNKKKLKIVLKIETNIFAEIALLLDGLRQRIHRI